MGSGELPCARAVPLPAASGNPVSRLYVVFEAMNKAKEMGLLLYGIVLLLGCLEMQHVSIK